jgi:hypothetical protein
VPLFALSFSYSSTEKVVNPYGSTAGANSGDFHLYRQTRAREMERMKQLTIAEREQQLDLEFQQTYDTATQQEAMKTAKKRQKRQHQKQARIRRKLLIQQGVIPLGGDNDDDDEDDEYGVTTAAGSTGTAPQEPTTTTTTTGNTAAPAATTTTTNNPQPVPVALQPPFPNDGSFLEIMKQQLEKDKATTE